MPEDFTLSNTRRFYSSKGDPLGVKGLSNWKEDAWKNHGFNRIRACGLCDIGAMLYQLGVTGSNPIEALIFSGFFFPICLNWKIHCDDHSSLLCTTAVLIWIISYILHVIKLVVVRMFTTPWMCVSEILWIQLSPSILLCIFTKKKQQNKTRNIQNAPGLKAAE